MASTDTGFNPLDPKESHVLRNKGTEAPHTGEYTDHDALGLYVCRQCNARLYRSDAKFQSHCGWPSFDDEIEGSVRRHSDADGMRVEIVCANCDGHLGHVFQGEGYTPKDTRHCVNSISMRFFGEGDELPTVLSGD
jgi:peptide-methionine (R)-S-oxide reductase